MLNHLKVLDISSISVNDVAKVGFTISQASQFILHEIPMPKSFVVTNEVFFDILETNALTLQDLATLNPNEKFDKLTIPEHTKHEILTKYGELSGFTEANVNLILVYFSKENKFNERLITFYNLKGTENLLNGIIKMIIDFAKGYSTELNNIIKGSHGISFLIQKTITPEVSGISYFVSEADIKIEAVFGSYRLALNENIQADEYIVDTTSSEIKEQNLSKQEYLFLESSSQIPNKIRITTSWQEKRKLEPKYIQLVSNITKNIQDLLSSNVKVSWVFEGGRIFIDWFEITDKSVFLNKTEEKKFDNFLVDTKEFGETFNTKEEIHKEIKDNMNFLMEGKYYTGDTVIGQVTFKIENQGKDKILVLKGDEDIPADLTIGGLIVEDSSEILAIKLNEIFNVPVITGAHLATQILKEEEIIKMEGQTGKIYVQSLLKTVDESTNPNSVKSDNEVLITKYVEPKTDQNFIQKSYESYSLRNQNNFIKENSSNSSPTKSISQNLLSSKDNVVYENEKIKIEKSTTILPKIKETKKINSSSLDISKLLSLIEDEDSIYKVNDSNSSSKQQDKVVQGSNFNVGRQIQNLISYSKKMTSEQALDILEETTEQINDVINSKEFEFDKNENYIQEKISEIKPPKTKKVKKLEKKTYIPTVTKVYGRLIDDIIGEEIDYIDGILFSSTQDIDTLMDLLETNLQKTLDKPVFVLSPSYEHLALKQYFEKLHNLRKGGYKNLKLILPDYRNRKEIVNLKKILNNVGLRRNLSFEIFANVSRTINVFRLSEIDETLVDGIFIDLFRLKMNMLGIEKYTASTKYVKGMKNLVEYVHSNIPNNIKVIIDITGFKNKKAILRHLFKLSKFNNITCETTIAYALKKELSILEQQNLEIKIKKNKQKDRYIY